MADGIARERIDQNKLFRQQMLDKHRPAFNLWFSLARLLEDAVIKERNLESNFSRTLDLLFIQAFKSHQALYLLCVDGFGEDAATIARRLFEIALQVGYLCLDETKREERGGKYLAHFWHNAKEMKTAVDLPEDSHKWWEKQYNHHKKFLSFNKNGEAARSWFSSDFKELAKQLGVEDTYEKDYRLLSHIAHGSSRGFLLKAINNEIQIYSDSFVEAILVYGTKYALCTAGCWNEHFAVIDGTKLKEIEGQAIKFEFKKR